MKSWSLTLHGPAGILSRVEAGESQFVIGTETAGDVFNVAGEGVALRHAYWLSANTGKEWRLPTNAEWEAAVGDLVYPWGDHFPPRWDDGNYPILENGKEDPKKIGVDLIYGTAPVGSFKPNALGLYDLGGNALEWMWDGLDPKSGFRVVRGGGWSATGQSAEMAFRWSCRSVAYDNVGFRLVRSSGL